jgi:hypothetical protein
MATYAGYQRYEVPDIGGNVAKIMLAQQEQDAKRMSAEELAKYRQAKLDADKLKEATKAGKEVEKQIDADATELRKTNLDIPATGYTDFDGLILGLAQKTTTDLNDNAKIYRAKGQEYLPEYNQNKQWLNGVSGKVKNTVTALEGSLKKIEESKNPNVFVKHFIGQTMKDVTPTEQNKLSLVPDVKTKSISFITYDKEGNPVSKPLESLNSVAALSEFEAPDYNADMKKLVDGVGVIASEQKWAGGSRTVIDPKSQENFDRTRKVYVNSVLNRPVVAADAYMKFVSTPADPALFISENASDDEKEMVAKQNGYESAKEADFVVYSTNTKTGLPEIKLTERQETKLRENLAQAFTDKSPYKESFALPSSTTTNINVVTNPEEKTGKTRTDLAMNLGTFISTDVGYKAAVSGLEKGMAEGKIASTGTKKPVIVKDENGKRTGEIIYYKKIGEYKGFTKYSDNPTIINVSNPDEAEFFRIEFGEVTGASKDRNEQQATHPEKIKK